MTRRMLFTLALVLAPVLAAAQQPTPTAAPAQAQQPAHPDSGKAHTTRMRHAAKKKGTAMHRDSTARHDTTKAKPKS